MSVKVWRMAKPERPAKHNNGDDNTERPLIALIEKILTKIGKEIRDALAKLQTEEQKRNENIMTALETLTASVTAGTAGQAELTTAVNAAIVKLGSPNATDAQLLTLASAIDSLTASDVALTTALNNAVTTPPVEPV